MRRRRSTSVILLLLIASCLSTLPAAASASAHDALLRRADRLLVRGPGGVPASPLPLPQLRDEAERLGEELEHAGLDSLAGLVLAEAGWASFRMGDPDRATLAFERAERLSGRAGSSRDQIAARNALASVTAALGETERAIRMWRGLRPLQVREGFLASTGRSWANVSMAYSMLGRPPEALEAADSAASYFAATPTPDGPSGVAIMRSQVYLSLQRPLEAEQWADSALHSARASGVMPAVGVALGLAAAAAEAQGKLEEAIARREEGIALQEAAGDRFLQAALRLARARLLTRLGRFDESRREIAGFLAGALQSKDPTFIHQSRTLDAINLLGLGRTDDALDTIQRSLSEYEQVQAGAQSPLARAGLLHLGGEAYAVLARAHLVAGREEDALLAIERGRAPELARRLGAASPREPGFTSRLRDRLRTHRGALLVWAETGLQPGVAVLVTPDAIRATELPAAPARDATRLALDRIAGSASDAECREALAEVARISLPPALGELPAAIERLYLVPPGGLAGFPLEVLPLHEDTGPSLGERFATSYLPSAAALAALEDRVAGTSGMVVFADPELPGAPDSGVALASATYRALRGTPLPSARSEARRIGIRGALVATGAEASEERLRAAIGGGPAVLHFATHALITALRPAESAVLLAGGDGRLTAGEIEALACSLDLVTLSGCRTAGGHVLTGEGTLGLPRSFLIAGSRAVVASLWDVEDAAAERFMTRFYEELRAGAPRDRALQAARAHLAARGASLRDRAAFILIGSGQAPVPALAGQALQTPEIPSWVWVLAMLVLVAGWSAVRRRNRNGRSAGLAQ